MLHVVEAVHSKTPDGAIHMVGEWRLPRCAKPSWEPRLSCIRELGMRCRRAKGTAAPGTLEH
uniref:Uncharacterized protein n=1 Tax=Macaca fascicularis TaxID=9541 RepID=A0A7N9DES5_MACFA